MYFEILKPKIFDSNKILSGVTKRNLNLFPDYGFSIAPAKIISIDQTLKNRIYLANFLNLEIDNNYCNYLKFQKQVHGNEIRRVDKNTRAFNYEEQTENDCMICAESGIVLCVTIADCCAILLFDPVKKVIAALHSGWKGTMLNIASFGIKKLHEDFGSNPKDLIVYLSPSASGENYEVGYDVAKYFPDSVVKLKDNKYLFDNRNEIKKQLIESGVLADNIEVSDICTISNINYHSHRRDGDKAGRMAAFIGMI